MLHVVSVHHCLTSNVGLILNIRYTIKIFVICQKQTTNHNIVSIHHIYSFFQNFLSGCICNKIHLANYRNFSACGRIINISLFVGQTSVWDVANISFLIKLEMSFLFIFRMICCNKKGQTVDISITRSVNLNQNLIISNKWKK